MFGIFFDLARFSIDFLKQNQLDEQISLSQRWVLVDNDLASSL